jgi:CMP-N-acetylneuraminic acid synthetase
MSGNLNILCTICARGGSKGVKDKNIRPLLGKPLIAYTIGQALRWSKARRIIVSTDSARIASIAKKYGATVPFMRPKKLAADDASKLLSVRHALIKCEKLFKERYDIIVDLDVSSPLRTVRDLDNCLQVFIKKRPQTLFSVVKAQRNPYFNMVEIKKDGFAKLCKQAPRKIVRRQDAPQVYSMNASIYFFRRDFLLDFKNTLPFSSRSVVYDMDDLSAHDIDSEYDLKFIEFLLKERIWKSEI